MGVLLVEQDIDMVLAACDRVTVLTGGSVLVSGTPDEVRDDPRVLEAYLGARPDVLADVLEDRVGTATRV